MYRQPSKHLYVVVLFLSLIALDPGQALAIFVALFYEPLRRFLERLGGLDEKDVRLKAKKFANRAGPTTLALLRVFAVPTLLVLRLVRYALGIDEASASRAREILEDFERFLG